MDNLKPVSILMVEDNLDHAELMIDAFQEFNVKNDVHHVLDGEQAIAYLNNIMPFDDKYQNPRPDIILMDLRMPRQDGITTLELIKSDTNLKNIPVVMVSTSKTSPEIEACYRLGASGYINKPIQFEDFSRKLKELNYYWVLTSELPENTEDR